MPSKLKWVIKIYEEDGIISLLKKSFSYNFRLIVDYILIMVTSFSAPIVRVIGEFTPNNLSLVLFSTKPGRLYEDNSRYLYEYILENEPDLDPVWITHDKDVYHNLTKQSLPVEYVYSIGGLWALWRASVGITTHGKSSFSFSSEAVPNSISIVVVGHGDPVKRTPWSPTEIENAKERLGEVDYQVTTSEFTREYRLEQYVNNGDVESLPKSIRDTFVTTGYPRSDLLFDPPKSTRDRWDEFSEGIDPNGVILYAPTKHYGIDVEVDDPAVDFFPFDDFDKDELYDFLEIKELLLLFRPHPNDVRKMENSIIGPYRILREDLHEMCDKCKYVQMATQFEYVDTTELLPFVDILVTDYSSIYHDFLLFDRPILFIPYDFELFESERGFRYDYYENLPGPEITSFEEFIAEISKIYEGFDDHQNSRRELRDLIHQYQDGNSRNRLTELILEMCRGQ